MLSFRTQPFVCAWCLSAATCRSSQRPTGSPPSDAIFPPVFYEYLSPFFFVLSCFVAHFLFVVLSTDHIWFFHFTFLYVFLAAKTVNLKLFFTFPCWALKVEASSLLAPQHTHREHRDHSCILHPLYYRCFNKRTYQQLSNSDSSDLLLFKIWSEIRSDLRSACVHRHPSACVHLTFWCAFLTVCQTRQRLRQEFCTGTADLRFSCSFYKQQHFSQ